MTEEEQQLAQRLGVPEVMHLNGEHKYTTNHLLHEVHIYNYAQLLSSYTFAEGVDLDAMGTLLCGYFDIDQPPVTCLIGSARFADEFTRQTELLTLQGHIVLSIGVNTKTSAIDGVDDPALKLRLDVLHLCKIDLASEVLVINVGGYIGESTRREIAYAQLNDISVRYLEPIDWRRRTRLNTTTLPNICKRK